MAYSTSDVYGKKHDMQAIALHLANKWDFDLPTALKEGYTHDQIVDHLNTKERTQDRHVELVMVPPTFLSTKISNNKWMQDMSASEKRVDTDKALAQWFDLYNLLAQDAVVWLVPPQPKLQDAVYVSNAGMVLPSAYKLVVLSKFKAPGRPGEEKALSQLLDLFQFEQHQCPHFFEGFAEMKWLRDDIYFCGWGMRSDIRAYRWMAEKFGTKNIYIKETDDLRYHLDCSIFVLNKECVLLAEDIPAEIKKQIEKVAEIVPVSKKDAQFSLTNAIRVGSVVYNATEISELKRSDKNYEPEKHKNEALEKICYDKGLSLVWINMSEFCKSGAACSCLVMPLTYIAYPA